jgi:hypothetical protein
MSLAELKEAINELSAEERSSLTSWLVSNWNENGVREEANRYGDDEEEDDADLQLAHERLAALANGTKRTIPEEEFWARMEAFKAALK